MCDMHDRDTHNPKLTSHFDPIQAKGNNGSGSVRFSHLERVDPPLPQLVFAAVEALADLRDHRPVVVLWRKCGKQLECGWSMDGGNRHTVLVV